MRLCNLQLPTPETPDVNRFLDQLGNLMNGAIRIFPKEITFKNSDQKNNYCRQYQEQDIASSYGLVSEVKFFQRVSVPSLYLICQQYV